MPDFEPTQPTAPRDSNTWKWVAIGCGGCLGLSVLMMVALGFLINRTMNISLDSGEVEAQAQELFDYQIPGGAKGLLNMNIMGIEIVQVVDAEEPPSVVMTVGRLPVYLQTESAQTSFLDSFQQEMSQDGGYQLTVERTEDLPLCGQTVPVRIQEGTFQDGEKSFQAVSYLAVVDHQNKERFAWILANGEGASGKAKSVFESLVCK